MNERILELFVQALEEFKAENKYATIIVPNPLQEKFAELIVRECANVIADDDLAKDCGTFLMDSYAKGMRYSAHLIREHFGVEE
jgi:hypothetical protein